MRKKYSRRSDKRQRLILSTRKATYAEIFLRVIKAGFGRKIKAEVYEPRNGFQMFVFFLEGKTRQRPITRVYKPTAFFADQYKLGILYAKYAASPISYHRTGFPKLPVVIVVRRVFETGKKFAFADADKVFADIVEASQNARLRAEKLKK